MSDKVSPVSPNEIAAQIVEAFNNGPCLDDCENVACLLCRTCSKHIAQIIAAALEQKDGRMAALEQERESHFQLEEMVLKAKSVQIAGLEQANKELLEALRIAESGMSETREIERDFDLDSRLRAVETMVHARDYLMQTRSERGLVTSLQSLELIRDGIKNALDGRATGREWRTVRHGYKIERDGPNVPAVSDEDCRCQQCGAVTPPALTHCINHRPPRAALSKHGGKQGE